METKSLGRLGSARKPLTVIGVLAIIGLIGGSAALASHSFVDVPNDHTFHNDIEWMKETGVTRGCNPPANTEYCPDEFTTRGQMAAFFHRFAQAGVVDADTLDGLDSTEFLGVNDKAADSDLLDGLDSTAFLQADGDGLEDAMAASVYISTATQAWLALADSEVIAACNAGDLLIGGGYQTEDTVEVNIDDNYPDGENWVVRGAATVAANVTAYAICIGS